mmetsp:Transcript_36442/g.93100  ORF Transcript_36442/g.93100 Transcript_36442/m.93100 type:complete len:204 (+) Transcript_36442:560-1171(+)
MRSRQRTWRAAGVAFAHLAPSSFSIAVSSARVPTDRTRWSMRVSFFRCSPATRTNMTALMVRTLSRREMARMTLAGSFTTRALGRSWAGRGAGSNAECASPGATWWRRGARAPARSWRARYRGAGISRAHSFSPGASSTRKPMGRMPSGTRGVCPVPLSSSGPCFLTTGTAGSALGTPTYSPMARARRSAWATGSRTTALAGP